MTELNENARFALAEQMDDILRKGESMESVQRLGQNTYFFSKLKLPYVEAESFCKLKGGHLVDFDAGKVKEGFREVIRDFSKIFFSRTMKLPVIS